MRKKEYDFLNYTSFPSSVKLISDEPGYTRTANDELAVIPGATIRAEFNAKQENVVYENSLLVFHRWSEEEKQWKWAKDRRLPQGTFDWQPFTLEFPVATGVHRMLVAVWGSRGTPELPGITWFDDLRIYQDGVLIYSNDFSKWDPVIGAGVGAGILGVVVPAVIRVPEPGVAYEYQKPYLEKEPLLAAVLAGLGALVGGGVGLLNAMGLVPQIPTPTLEAPLEVPEAPARMGKYLVTG